MIVPIGCIHMPELGLTLSYDVVGINCEDGGRTVHDKDPVLSKLMKAAAGQINIKGHLAGPVPASSVFLYAPTDIEGHHATDGRYYVVGSLALPGHFIN